MFRRERQKAQAEGALSYSKDENLCCARRFAGERAGCFAAWQVTKNDDLPHESLRRRPGSTPASRECLNRLRGWLSIWASLPGIYALNHLRSGPAN
jgi:hypothetical protein